ncbi:solute carrier family 41 member 1-like isoform X3 [Channa argus]|uniref:solute carrier family 41 member 1-like isoform X3 n=1 Tax=Channa argus TaxID=215402 RepID=UPI003522BC09
MDHRCPGPAALSGVRPGHGGSRDSHGYSATLGGVQGDLRGVYLGPSPGGAEGQSGDDVGIPTVNSSSGHSGRLPGSSCSSASWGSDQGESGHCAGCCPVCQQRHHCFHCCTVSRFSDGCSDHWLQESRHQPGQRCHTHRCQPRRPHHSIFARWDMWYLPPVVCGFFVLLIPAWVIIACHSPSIREVLKSGWQPVILAMTISSIGGLILDNTVSNPNFEGMAVFTPVINGVGGNLVAIQASRMSTYLHYWSVPGALPFKMSQSCPGPCATFCSSDVNSKSAGVLATLVVPGHLFFLCTIHLLHGGHIAMTPIFIICYLFAALLQVVILLYVASLLVRWLWQRGLDPDNFSIPYLTALGDLLGTGFLAVSFKLILMVSSTSSGG